MENPILTTESRIPNPLARLRGGLIVSCQAQPHEPTYGPSMMAAMARAALIGGAVGIRANGPADIAAIRQMLELPIVGLYKINQDGFEVRITPTFDSAAQIVAAGADIVALDATKRPHPEARSAADMIRAVKEELHVLVMADVADVEEGRAAAEAGADLISTTLSGYTRYSPQQLEPDFELVLELVRQLQIPVVAEGRISSPEQARRALDLGAYAVVVGSMITNPLWITQQYVKALQGAFGE